MTRTLTENPTMLPAGKPVIPPVAQSKWRFRTGPVSPWKWAVISCLFLAISGGIRIGRDLRFSGQARSSKKCPFPLSEIPRVMGTWSVVENSETTLDPEIARLAGTSDHVIRSYVDSTSGEEVSVLVLYGLADSVFGHTPELCYKAAGYRLVPPIEDRELSMTGSTTPVRYRSAFFSRTAVGLTRYTEVIWSFWHGGSWWPDVGSRWKQFRYSPGMFKIQLQRPTTALSGDDSPSESLLREIVREINARIDRAKAVSAVDSKQAKTPP